MSKFDKFVMVDPLGDEEASMQEAVTKEVDKRMGKAVEEIGERYSEGRGGFDAGNDSAPTGAAYQQAFQQRKEREKAAKEAQRGAEMQAQADEEELERQMLNAKLQNQGGGEESDDDDDDKYLDGLDDDPALAALREKRLKTLQAAHIERNENLAKGHGQYREVGQDDFLAEVCGSKHAVCHFYHSDFERCKIMDHHIAKLAPQHIECKFVKINAAKAPFFVEKLKVKTLPCVLIFEDGITNDRIDGFDGLADEQEEGKEDEWETGRLARRLALAQAIQFTAEDQMKDRRQHMIQASIREGISSLDSDDDEY